jgi:hypothetical protein
VGGGGAHVVELRVEVEERVGGVVGRAGVGCDRVVVGAAVDLDLAALPCEDPGAGGPECVGVAGGELDAVLLSRAGDDLDDEGRGRGGVEAPFPAWSEGDDAGRGGLGLGG